MLMRGLQAGDPKYVGKMLVSKKCMCGCVCGGGGVRGVGVVASPTYQKGTKVLRPRPVYCPSSLRRLGVEVGLAPKSLGP